MPRPVQRDLPTYTKRAKRKKQEGRVALELLIHETGRVAELRLRETIPGSDLNDTVIESAWHWRFVPASKSGVPVRVWKPVTVDFSIVSGQTRVHISE
jgi:protein TonB